MWKCQGSFFLWPNFPAYLRLNQRKSWSLVKIRHRMSQPPGVECNYPLFRCNSCSLCCTALLTTDGAISNSKEPGDRLLAARRKIKIKILLEKLTCNRTPMLSVYHVSGGWAMIRKKPFGRERKAFCLQKCLSVYGRWLMCLFSVESCYLSGVWIISHRAKEAHAALILSPESQFD